MQKTYEAPKAEAVKFDNTDIIRTSEEHPTGCIVSSSGMIWYD